MIVLGIESTAHTFGIGIIKDREILSDCRSTYFPKEGGIHPTKATEHHTEVAISVLEKALNESGLKEKDIDLISFAQGPGMPPCLDTGIVLARSLALKLKKPLIGVNHAVAHIEIGKLLSGAKNPVVLYVSGGNSQILSFSSGKYRIFGETLDIAIGNALDKFARTLGIPHPGGPEIEKLAKKGENIIELPYIVKGMDFSFSGLVTSLQEKYKSGKYLKEDLCFSFQEYAFSMLIEATERALAHLGKSEVLLTGGVAANSRFKEMLEVMCKERGAKIFETPKKYCGDNGTMIAYLGLLEYKSGKKTTISQSKKRPHWRADEVDIKWM